MGTYKLQPAEQYLFDQVGHGDAADLGDRPDRRIRAVVLRHILLGLPVIDDNRRVWRALTALVCEPEEGRCCPLTGAGIAVANAVIEGRLELDSAMGAEGGPIWALEFTRCHFARGEMEPGGKRGSGFSGRNAHFARLAFRECSFHDPPVGNPPSSTGSSEPATPTIDLSGAAMDGDLDMRSVKPVPGGFLWIRAIGSRIDGQLDLSRARLQAPPDTSEGFTADPPVDALDLTGAEVLGDFLFLNGGRSTGRIRGRGAKITGDVWMTGAEIENPGGSALFFQGATVGGMMMLDSGSDRADRSGEIRRFRCIGSLNLVAAEIGRDLQMSDSIIDGAARFSDLNVRNDLFFGASVSGIANLTGCRIGGTLDLSKLILGEKSPGLGLANGRVGRSLTLDAEMQDAVGAPVDPGSGECPVLRGEIDLENLSCDMLDDLGGRCWGTQARIHMNHFTYSRATWEPVRAAGRRPWRERVRQDYRRKLKRVAAEWLPNLMTQGLRDRLRVGDHWTTWQVKRNWIFRQFDTSREPSPARYRLESDEYRPQPFEQAIRVARAEGREDFAIHFEIAKRNVEWRLFSRRHREWFALLGIAVGTAWLATHRFGWDAVLVALLFAVAFTYISDFFHLAMHYMFGHLRRPIRATTTLIVAFLIGWLGVEAAHERGMLVVDVDPVASAAGQGEKAAIIGFQAAKDLVSDVPCPDEVSEALYALDVLIPLIDLREESRCEVGRAAGGPYDRGGLLAWFEALTDRPSTFWAVLKALYAIAGWFIISLSILTFAHVARTPAEPS